MPASSDPTLTTATATVVLPADLHARPAGQIAQAAVRFRSKATLQYGDRSAPATAILSILGLGDTAGSTITLQTEGPDAEEALKTLTKILAESE